jgi:hypothetical protein
MLRIARRVICDGEATGEHRPRLLIATERAEKQYCKIHLVQIA